MKKIGKLLTAFMVVLTLNIGGVFAEGGAKPPDLDNVAFTEFLNKGVTPNDSVDFIKFYKGDPKELTVGVNPEHAEYVTIKGTNVTFKKTGVVTIFIKVKGKTELAGYLVIQSKTKVEELKSLLAKEVTEGDKIDLSNYFKGKLDEFTVYLEGDSKNFAAVKEHTVTFNKAGTVRIGVDIIKAVFNNNKPGERIKEYYDVVVKAKDSGGTTPPGKPDEGDPHGGKPEGDKSGKDPKQQPQAQKTNNKGTKSKVVKTSDNTSIIAYSVAGLFSIVIAIATKKRLSANK